MKIENLSLDDASPATLNRMLKVSIGDFFDDDGRLLPVEILAEQGLDKLAKSIKFVEKKSPDGRVIAREESVELWDVGEIAEQLGILEGASE